MFVTEPVTKKIFDWMTFLVLLHETLLLPRFWFLYYDWQLGKDLSNLEWKQQLYLGQLRIQEASEDDVTKSETMSRSELSPNASDDAIVNRNASINDGNDEGNIKSGVDLDIPVPTSPLPEIEITNIEMTTEAAAAVPSQPSLVVGVPGLSLNTYTYSNTARVVTITRDSESDKLRWTLRYRKYLGNTRIMLVVFSFYYAIFLGLIAVMRFYVGYQDAATICVGYSVCTGILILMCGFKIIKCRDLFEIQSLLSLMCIYKKNKNKNLVEEGRGRRGKGVGAENITFFLYIQKKKKKENCKWYQ
ncbi:hypothetical protein RFI_14657 [Reticulomyxa filosa]|uniref:Uncharacterized protein n=1 Tax=Reticulomyxa filosa TaxID=46433 RepID=X6NB49_RETFI|nr:hypothetical protein RFI_14657 [Reticulomyxa filosa]|eukprot:ETO22542.1 hypothetical protein RFI_14657 [Reticulomyxa filosa]